MGTLGELPDTIGPYAVEGVIGRGGMGVVYRARGADGLVALKVLRGDASRPDEMRKRFAQEARVRIEHPNIARTIDAGEDRGTLWIAFELLSGRSLGAVLAERGRSSIEEAWSIARQAAAGLGAAHAAGVVHRDIKPGNLFVCDDGTVRLLDFGIARITDRDTRLTATGHLVGTAAYLSPEQARGEAFIDARSDVWSLGVVLYEVLTGKHPFDRGSLMATMLAVLAEHAPPVTALRSDTPPVLARAITRCLARLPEHRFANGDELSRALTTGEIDDVRTPDVHGATAAALPIPGTSIPIGEQRVVAVMLADGVEDRDAVARAIEEAGGVVVPLGDRALGLFGSLAWEGDEMDRAARAALAARRFAARVSVASGRARYSGTTGITGSVLEAAEEGIRAALDGVALDETTTRALRVRFTVRARDGGGELIEAARLPDSSSLRAGPGTGPSIAPPHGITVGREAELAQLRRAVRTLDEDAGAEALLVIGPPGTGKSHLRWEMARILESEASQRPRILSARAEPLHRDVAFSLFRELLRSRAHSGQESDGWPQLEGGSREEERAAIDALAREADVDPRFVRELLSPKADPGIEAPELTAARRDPRLMADRLRFTLSDWLSALCDRGPTALLLDDLQWGDDASLDLLEELASSLADAPFLVFACARPELIERRPSLLSGILAARLEPRPLLVSEVEELARALAGRPIPDGLARRLFERTGGNPLFIEQIVRALDEEGRLDEAQADTEELPLPLTVEATVQSRLDHLPGAEKELCKRAAIFERAALPEELEVLGLFEPKALLASLVRRDVLAVRGRSRGSGRYQFRSALVREVAYGMLGEALREDLHARIATYLAGREDGDAEEIAIHFFAARQAERAAMWSRRAALAASRRGDPAAALRNAGRAIELGALEKCELHFVRSESFEAVGDLEAQGRELELASANATTELERARVDTDLAVWCWRTGQPERATELARSAVRSARAAGDPETLALSLGRAGVILTYAGALAEARAHLAEAEPIARGLGVLLSAHAASWQAQLANAAGDQGERRRAYREAARLYEQAGDVRRMAGAELNLADAANRVGAYVEAATALAAASDKAERVGNTLWRGYAQLNLGYALARLGRTREAEAALGRAEEVAEQTGEARLRSFAAIYRARSLLIDAPNEAAKQATAAAEEAAAHKLPAGRALACTVAALAHLACGRSELADRASRDALELRDELGAIEEDEADVFVVRAQVLEALGRHVEAHDVRMRGRARVRELADRILDPELRARFLEDVPAHRDLMA